MIRENTASNTGFSRLPSPLESGALDKPAAQRLFLAIIGLLLLYNLATIGRVPAYITDDDGAYASAAYQFWQTGRPGVPGYKEVVGLNVDVWPFGRIAAAVQGIFIHFGGVSIFAAFLPSFLAGVGLVFVTAALARTLWDKQTALTVALLLAASGKFFDACRWARPDILLAFCFAFSLWQAAAADSEKPYLRLFLAGLVMGLAGDIHLNGFLLAPVPLLFWLLLRPQPKLMRLKASMLFIGAGILGALYWVGVHCGLHPRALLDQARLYGGRTHRLSVFDLGLWGALGTELKRYTTWFWAARGHRHLIEGACVAAAGAWMLFHEARKGIAIVSVWVAIFVIAALCMSNPFGWYLIFVWPVFAIWMGRMLRAMASRRLAQVVLTFLLIAYVANLGLWDFKARKEIPLQAKLQELRKIIPADAPVLGNGAFWFGFWDRDFTDDYYLSFRKLEAGMNPSSRPTGWIEEQKRRGWRYIVAYGDFRLFLDPQVPLSELLSLPIYSKRVDEIREARAFSLERCSIERRIAGVSDTILVLQVAPSKNAVYQTSWNIPREGLQKPGRFGK